ncbi:alpha/beta hydrolase fold domain-containing protein [Pseudarthrobacter sp. lyk4-40-TYG-27]|uniref:flavin-containing monooxygenase n=1 Tax=Pseudarthrobacter sp. lyk4-40-TYG-27 TaxID=3040305 RepID=UPI00255520AC|nr:alpha/beta hydrolase fold domain-containing protein [Pseudarthrobacter sp. lyk4-40-TYG-27]
MTKHHDVVVIGAGFSGLYSVHKLRDELGLDVQGFEAAGGVGGTWWWNRYPGARCDFESVHYSYSFSEELQREWKWTEKFASQPEILAYLEWVADKLDVRRSFRFGTRITSTIWDEDNSRWQVAAEDGTTCTARFVISGVGGLSVPKEPEFAGADSFEGELYFTSSWPHHEVNLAGKRVAVVGTGSTGIQVIQEVARQAAHLTVFQRTANFAAPLGNEKLEPERQEWNAKNHAELRAGSRQSLLGVPYEPARQSALEVSEEERKAVYDKNWSEGGFRMLASTFTDLYFDERANDTIADYIRGRIRERVNDPATAELLCPDDHPYATKRPPFETGYYEAFNLPHVDLVDLRSAPIEEITPKGIATTAAHYEFDLIILATGFDVFTRPQLNLGLIGREGIRLEDKWGGSPATYLGISTAGFPNLFMINGPQSAAAQYNSPLAIEDHVDFATRAISHTLKSGAKTIEASAEAEQTWDALATGMLNMTLVPKATNSWFNGDNIPGKARAAYYFAGGTPMYRAILNQVQDRTFAGFALDGGAPLRIPPLVRLHPSAVAVLAGMLNQGVKPLENCTPEEMRALVGAMTKMQVPGPDLQVIEVEDPNARIYIPDGDGPFPVVVFYHGGGWVAGSVEVADAPCRQLAEKLGAIVVSAAYRLTPEHPFPAATDDTFAALQWTVENIGAFRGNPERIMVMGESAGATLAAVAALRARDAGIDLLGQVLVNPAIDPEAQTASKKEFFDGPFLTVAAGDAIWGAYLSGAEITAYAAPGRAESFAGLAPAIIITVECDPTRDEAEDYGRAMAAAGVPVVTHRIPGQMHAVFPLTAVIPQATEMQDIVAKFLSDQLPERGLTTANVVAH